MDHQTRGDGSATAQLTSPFRDFDASEAESPQHEDFSWGEDEDELEHDVQFEEESEDEAELEEETEDEAQFEDEAENEEQFEFGEAETYEVGPDPSLVALAERIASRSELEFEDETRRRRRWTRCFVATDIQRAQKTFQDNAAARSGNADDSCSCIVMLNVALARLLTLPTRDSFARGGRHPTTKKRLTNRKVKMARLTTKSIEKAMAQLQARGYASRPIEMNFLDRRNKRAGTLKPVKLRASVSKRLLALSQPAGCWYAYGLSIMDGYHSVLLLVDRTGTNGNIYWLDQFSSGVNDNVTSSLDARLTQRTQEYWQGVKDKKKIGSDTSIRLWPLRKRLQP